MIWVKICGLKSEQDAKWAEACGADALGFVFEPTSPRCIGGHEWHPAWVEEIGVEMVAVYGPAPAQLPSAPFQTIQATDWSRAAGSLGGKLRQVVVRVGLNETPERILRWTPGAHRLVLDAHSKDAYGGSGQRIDWDLAAEVVRRSRVPVILAGGLTPENVGEAIMKVKPFGVDVSSGVESEPGVKDPVRVKRFIEVAKEVATLTAQRDWALEASRAY